MKSLTSILRPAKILFPLIFGALLLSNSIKAQKVSFFGECTGNLKYREDPSYVKNIPLYIRDVPKHRKDDYAKDKNVAPIMDEKIDLVDRGLLLEGKLGTKFNILKENVYLAFGAGVDLEFKDGSSFSSKSNDIVERNYTNYPGTSVRGKGAALTYYGVHRTYLVKWNPFLKPKLLAELGINIFDRAELVLGYDIFSEKIIAKNGWDRGDRTQTNKRYNLMNVLSGGPYLSLNILGERREEKGDESDLYFGIEAGKIHPLFKQKKAIAEDAVINLKDNWFVGVHFKIRFNEL